MVALLLACAVFSGWMVTLDWRCAPRRPAVALRSERAARATAVVSWGRLGRVIGCALALVLAGPFGVAVGVGLWWWRRSARSRRTKREHRRRVTAGLAEVCDLFVVAASAGLTVSAATTAVADRCPAPFSDALGVVVASMSRGERISDALTTLPDMLGEPVRPLVRALVAADRYGVALLGPLADVADEARRERRRAIEIEARRLPVLLLFPLVLCILPAFALMTVVPSIIASLSAFRR